VEELSEVVAEEMKFNQEKIQSAVRKLSPMSRAVFNLYVVDGYKHEEIAGMLEISPNTSKVHLHRAKKQLKQLLGGRNELTVS
jgi:RNA polymerase sigma-70 factor (ECF subfamily)